MEETKIKPKKRHPKWIAVDIDHPTTIISEGNSPQIVMRNAKKTGKRFSMRFVYKPNTTFIL